MDELVSLYARDAVRGGRVQRLAAELFDAVPTAHGLPAAAADVVRAQIGRAHARTPVTP